MDLARVAVQGPLSFSLDIDQRIEHEEGQDNFAVRVTFELEITTPPDDDGVEDRVATIKVEYGALYDLVGLDGYQPTAKEFEAYAETAATLTLYPYAREFMSSMTNRLGLPRLVLPMHRLPSPWHPDAELGQGTSD